MRIIYGLCIALLFAAGAIAEEPYPVGFKVRLVQHIKITLQNPDPIRTGGLQDGITFRPGDACSGLPNGALTVIGKAPVGDSLVVYYETPPTGFHGCPRGAITFMTAESLGHLVDAVRTQDAVKEADAREKEHLRKMIREHESKTTRRMWGP